MKLGGWLNNSLQSMNKGAKLNGLGVVFVSGFASGLELVRELYLYLAKVGT